MTSAAEKAGTARILRGVAGQYLLYRAEDAFKGLAVPRGIFRKRGHRPLAGDLVEFESSGDPDIPWVITEILPRRNVLIRPPAANLDLLIITAAATLPRLDYLLVDKLLAYAAAVSVDVLLVLSKCDEAESGASLAEFRENYSPAGFPILAQGKGDDEALTELREAVQGKIAAFCGQSGAGKSTLLNRLFERRLMPTATLSEKGRRGRQTTRSIEFFPVGGAFLADTPGFQSFSPEELHLTADALLKAYPELLAIADRCRFNNCRHLGEAGCAVAESAIHPERLRRYRELREAVDRIKNYAHGSDALF